MFSVSFLLAVTKSASPSYLPSLIGVYLTAVTTIIVAIAGFAAAVQSRKRETNNRYIIEAICQHLDDSEDDLKQWLRDYFRIEGR